MKIQVVDTAGRRGLFEEDSWFRLRLAVADFFGGDVSSQHLVFAHQEPRSFGQFRDLFFAKA